MPFDDPACFRLDRIAVRPIHWLWRPYLAYGKLAILDGDPGTSSKGASRSGNGPNRPRRTATDKANGAPRGPDPTRTVRPPWRPNFG